MRIIIIYLVLIIISLFYSCQKEQIISPNNDEMLLTIKQRIYFGECIGYCDTKLIIDSTNVKYIQNGWDEKGSLSEKDTSFNINITHWEKIKKSFSLKDFFLLDSAYIEKYYVDDGLVTLEVLTDKRYKKVEHDFSKTIKILDSLYILLNNFRRNL